MDKPVPLTLVKTLALSFAVFVLLAVRFGPNWLTIYHNSTEAATKLPHAVVEKAFMSGYTTTRGFYVVAQSKDLRAEIPDPHHKIVRWRLLPPLVGKLLQLPGWATLALAPLACLPLLALIAWVIGRYGNDAGFSIACGAATIGASAPLFVSLGWLGYYDSWLAAGLIVTAFVPSRIAVLFACLLVPWVDERFAVALPLALLVRWSVVVSGAMSPWEWLKREAIGPVVLTAVFVVLRLALGGTGGSQSITAYWHQFVVESHVRLGSRLIGALGGLRVGWVLIALAIIYSNGAARWMLALVTVATLALAVFSAQDTSRSTGLLLPVAVLGWIYGSRQSWWQRHHVAPVFAAVSLVLPATLMIGNRSVPVDATWRIPIAWKSAENTLGYACEAGIGVPKDMTQAVNWYRKAAEHGLREGQYNLGRMYVDGVAAPKDLTAALDWFRRAAVQGHGEAQNQLGAMYANGTGVPRNEKEAAKWIHAAALNGIAEGQKNLGLLYLFGLGVNRNLPEAYAWLNVAADSGNVDAKRHLAELRAQLPPADLIEAMKLANRHRSEIGG